MPLRLAIATSQRTPATGPSSGTDDQRCRLVLVQAGTGAAYGGARFAQVTAPERRSGQAGDGATGGVVYAARLSASTLERAWP